MSVRKVAIAADDARGLDGEVSMHFGRCPHYVIADVDGGRVVEVGVEANPFFGNHRPGQVPMFVGGLGVQVILAGGMGPRAQQMFTHQGIEVVTGAVGNVGKVLEAYLDGHLSGYVPCNHDHSESCKGR